MARAPEWQEPEKAILRTHYRRRSVGWIRAELRRACASERTAHAIRHEARELGLTAARKGLWTADEDALFADHSDSTIARRTGRPRDAVRKRRAKLGVEHARTTLSPVQIGELLHRDAATVREWIRAGRLERVGAAQPDYQVRPKDLRAFLVDAPWAINVRESGRLEPELVQLLAGRW